MPCRVTQDGRVMVESSDKLWSTGEGNGKPLQYSRLENPMNSMKAGREGDNRGWDGGIATPTQWTWVWVDSGSWWWTERPVVPRSMGSQRVRHTWVTKLNWTEHIIRVRWVKKRDLHNLDALDHQSLLIEKNSYISINLCNQSAHIHTHTHAHIYV